MQQTDEQTKSKIVNRLRSDGRIDEAKIEVTVQDAVVTLLGEVPTYFAYKTAYRDALETDEVKSVRNELVVRYPAGAVLPTDASLLSAVEHRLRHNPDIDISDMEISSEAGRVVLRGTVDAYWKKKHAEEVIATEPGILEIANHLAVVPARDVVDQDIAVAIVSALEGRAAVSADDVEVTVTNGRVELNGDVFGWAGVQAAQEAAEYTEGVIEVVNNLTSAKRA